MLRLFRFGMFAILLLTGCGRSGPERVDVTGTFSYDGKPVAEGALELIPKPGTNAPAQPITVRDGKFSAKGEYGVLVGDYQVIFHSYKVGAVTSSEQKDESGKVADDVLPAFRPNIELLPKKYSTEQSTETLSLKSGDGSKTVAYDLKK